MQTIYFPFTKFNHIARHQQSDTALHTPAINSTTALISDAGCRQFIRKRSSFGRVHASPVEAAAGGAGENQENTSEKTATTQIVPSLSSWAEDDASSSSNATTTSEELTEWAAQVPPSHRPHSRHPVGNALFGVALGSIAIAAFFMGRKYSAYHLVLAPEEVAMAANGEEFIEKTTSTSAPSSSSSFSSVSSVEKGPQHEEPLVVVGSKPEEVKIHPVEEKHKLGKQKQITTTPPAASVAGGSTAAPLNNKKLGKGANKKESEGRKTHHHVDTKPPPPPLDSSPQPVAAATKEEENSTPSKHPPLEKDAQSVNVEKSPVDIDDDDDVVVNPATAVAVEVKDEVVQQQVEEELENGKFPLRSPEAAAAVAHVQAVQRRRQHLYDRAIDRQEKRLKHEEHEQEAGDKEYSKTNNNNSKTISSHPIRVASKETTTTTTAAAAAADIAAELIIAETDAALAEIPEGMSFIALRERATTANKAAAAAASAAHRAATASALAASAADSATHAAQKAALAASRCLTALDLRAADEIEKAYHAAIEAEKRTAAAAVEASVASAHAVVSESDAEKHAERAWKAGELSRPRGVVAQSTAAWQLVRQQYKNTKMNVLHGTAAVRHAVGEGVGKVQATGRVAVERVKEVWSSLQQRLHQRRL